MRSCYFVIILISIMSLLSGCGASKERETADMLPVNETNDGILIDDILDCKEMLGKTPEEAGIPATVIDTKSFPFPKTYADGNIFGIKDYGVIYFSKDDAGEPDKVDSVWIHVKGAGFEHYRDELEKLYGQPVDEGETPYVEADGGAVMWAKFQDGDIVIRLSNASERDYTEIEITQKQ